MVALNVLEMHLCMMATAKPCQLSPHAVLAAQKVLGVIGLNARFLAAMVDQKEEREL
jgi:hypothetical protein